MATVDSRLSPGSPQRPPPAARWPKAVTEPHYTPVDIVIYGAYRNIDDGTQDPTTTYVYSVTGALQSGKTVASVTLPSPSGGYVGVFAIGAA